MDLHGQLKRLFEERFSANRETRYGVEQEFFLVDRAGIPATLDQSQAFLLEISNQNSWYVREFYEYEDIQYIWRVSQEVGQNRYIALKYDHPPHLIELASSVHSSIRSLRDEISRSLDTIDFAAEKVGLVRSRRPFLEMSGSDPRIISHFPEFIELRATRRRIAELHGKTLNPNDENYAALIAATQINISGAIDLNSNTVNRLYILEAMLTQRMGKGLESDWFYKRWHGFDRAFGETPLGGFPRLPSWTFDGWIDALLNTPIKSASGSDAQGLTLRELHNRSPYGTDHVALIKSLRDLQLIRPKLFGGLEFRSAPAQASSDDIISLVIARDAALKFAASSIQFSLNYVQAREIWIDCLGGEGAQHKLRPKVDSLAAAFDRYAEEWNERLRSA